MSGTRAIHEVLRASQVPRAVVADLPTTTRVRDHAKVVAYVVDGASVYALLPVSLAVNLERLSNLAGAGDIRLARDDEGLGPHAGEPIFVDARLALSHEIVVTADRVVDTVVMRWVDFARHLRPIVGDFADPPRDRVGAYRLSYRE